MSLKTTGLEDFSSSATEDDGNMSDEPYYPLEEYKYNAPAGSRAHAPVVAASSSAEDYYSFYSKLIASPVKMANNSNVIVNRNNNNSGSNNTNNKTGRRQRKSKTQAKSNLKSTKTNNNKRKRAPPRPKLKSTGTPHHTGPFAPIRDYYHSKSFLRIKDNEWEKNIDSDDDLDQEWLHEIESSEIHDFTDIKPEEKKLMLLWNEFVRSDTIIPAKRIPQICLDFVEKHYKKIREDKLDSQLPWHLTNLWDEGLISADHLSFCIEHYYVLAG